ncbi:MAG: hypothetical protein QG668_614 [Patescibacteria group bacterium]|jgi:hypothetical protein|nr:hypothetical protein [Patescibacteria group bacterium]
MEKVGWRFHRIRLSKSYAAHKLSFSMEHLSRRRRFVVRVLAVFMIGAMVLFAVAPLAGF